MKFTRTMKPAELALLGDDPKQALNDMIDVAMKYREKIKDPASIEHRVLSLLNKKTGISPQQILGAHNAMNGKSPIKLAYVRFTLSGMHSAGLVKREGRGKYVKA